MMRLRRRWDARKSWAVICHMPIDTRTLLGALKERISCGEMPEAISDMIVRTWARWPSGR